MLALPGSSASQAAVIFKDTFTGVSNLNAIGWHFYNSSGAGTAWQAATPTSPVPVSPLSGAVMRNNAGTQANTNAVKQWSPITLITTGDSIALSLDFQTLSIPTTSRLGITLSSTHPHRTNHRQRLQRVPDNPCSDAELRGPLPQTCPHQEKKTRLSFPVALLNV